MKEKKNENWREWGGKKSVGESDTHGLPKEDLIEKDGGHRG